MSHAPLSDRNAPPDVYANAAPPAPPAPPLDGPRRVDVAVIGAGFTGLSAALHVAETGADVAVLEAKEIGWGASGRAFGQVVPYLKIEEPAILRHYGPERGPAIIEAVASGPDLVFGLIERHGIECWPMRTGLIFAAHAPAGQRALERRAAFWQQRNAPVELLDARQCAEMIGSPAYRAATIDRRGGHINPFAYVRGLARAAVAARVVIHANSPVDGISRADGNWRIRTARGEVTARCVILATNAYTTALWPGLRESVVPVRSYGFVSAPLSDNLRQSILPGRQSLSDTRRMVSAVRMLPDGRLHASARGPLGGPERPPEWRGVNDRVLRLFPQLERVAWEASWTGFIAMTVDHVPRLHELAPGLFAGLGYNGRGIAAATMMGRDLARLVGGVRETSFPLVPLRPLPLAPLLPMIAQGMAGYYRARDWLDQLMP
jgi:glycine/D-amino acid oxidase-like deaminating enzyme